MTVGNPVRELSYKYRHQKARIDVNDTSPLKLLVIGGSLGAQALNNHIAHAKKLESMPDAKPWQVRHQCNKNNQEATQAVYREAQLQSTRLWDFAILSKIWQQHATGQMW